MIEHSPSPVVVVTGGRAFRDPHVLWAALGRIYQKEGIRLLIQGGATGADALARTWASRNDIPVMTVPAEWQRLGKGAGPARNRKMHGWAKSIATAWACELVCVVFPGGRGTAHSVKCAQEQGARVIKVVS